jgi:TRAP-type uncharacterized transport system fused permease subunit
MKTKLKGIGAHISALPSGARALVGSAVAVVAVLVPGVAGATTSTPFHAWTTTLVTKVSGEILLAATGIVAVFALVLGMRVVFRLLTRITGKVGS